MDLALYHADNFFPGVSHLFQFNFHVFVTRCFFGMLFFFTCAFPFQGLFGDTVFRIIKGCYLTMFQVSHEV